MLPFAGIEAWVINLSSQVHLAWFVFLGEIVEEIISPIPSQAILLTGGSLAQAGGYGLWSVLFFAILASFAKSVTTMGYYMIGDKLEDRLVPLFGKYVGITHERLESIGKQVGAGGFWSIFLIRCLPIIPSAPVSLACGALKIHAGRFFFATFAGNALRGGMIFLTGYLGFDVFRAFTNGAITRDIVLVLAVLLGLVGGIVWTYWRRYQEEKKETR